MINIYSTKQVLYSTYALVLVLCSCNRELDSHNDTSFIQFTDNILRFNSLEELNQVVNSLKISDTYNLNTKTTPDFVSLRQSLIEQGLRNFTDEELTIIQEEGLLYEPEDSLISDPYYCAVLNKDREIIVGNNYYRYVKDGVIKCNVSDLMTLEDTLDNQIQSIDTSELSAGETVTLRNDVQFTKLDYSSTKSVETDSEILSTGGNIILRPRPDTPPQSEENPSVAYDGTKLILADGTSISKNNLRSISFKNGEENSNSNDINWFERLWGEIVGLNVYAIQEYDSRHRMKLKLFCEDYLIYRSVGMTVRMQKKVLGIWWRIKADEFRYGWSAIECIYKYPQILFPQPPPINGIRPVSNIPAVMKKNFPFAEEDIILMNLDFINYDFTTGDLNRFLCNGIKSCANTLQKWINSNGNDADNPKGLFAVNEDDNVVYVVFPQGEELAYNTGREIVKWDCDWFYGKYVIGFSFGLGYSYFGVSSIQFESASKISIGRGCIYAAVKFNGEWRGCVIRTE